MNRKPCLAVLLSLFLLVPAVFCAAQVSAPVSPFALRDGDRVVFFGDSITEQRLYTRFVEQYALTRFPRLKITFFNAGVGGDKVSGGWAGPIDLRLRRDVFAYQPTVVTIMLGMNDGYYRPMDDGILQTYTEGYRHIVDSVRTGETTARMTLIKPSPFDDVTRPPQFEGGYNGVLVRMGTMLATLAAEKGAGVADMNTPVVAALTKAKALDPAFSTALMFDRVHPGAGIHWIMAAALLKSWNAPAIVTAVKIDAANAVVTESTNTEITQLRKTKTGVLSWTQRDRALPLPLPSPAADPVTDLALKASTVLQDLDQETLSLTGLRPGQYEVRIDDWLIGTFNADELSSGINLATMDTPMLAQARLVAVDNGHKNSLEATRFSMINHSMDSLTQEAAGKLERALAASDDKQRSDAQPVPHNYTLTPVNALPGKAAGAH